MRICPKCRRAFPHDESHCTDDGTPTVDGGEGALAMTAIGPGAVHDTPHALPAVEVAEEDPRIGKVVGGVYRIRERIAAGGMGVVYLAEHLHIGRKFALKLLTKAVAQNPTAIERLKQEAIAASRIEHDNIVEIVSFDTTPEGEVFIVMELLRGTDLAGLLGAEGALPLDRAVAISVQICRAVGAAHAAGIIHRDLKPENVFVTQKGERDFVKVLDFGISKVKDAEVEAVRMTKTGQLVGTPLYMSPEQARGESEIDKRADIYAVGVILYEMLVGETPFVGENYFQLLWKHTHETPMPPSHAPGGAHVPPALEAVVLRTLSKDREERFQSMEELESAILKACPGVEAPAVFGTATRTRSMPTEPMVAPAKRRSWVGWAAVLGAAIVAGGIWLGMKGGEATAERHEGSVEEESAPSTSPSTATSASTSSLAEVTVAFDAEGGAVEVRRDGEVVGTTPFALEVARAADPIHYTFHRRGYMDGAEDVVPSEDRVVEVSLRPIPRKGGPTKRGSGGPIKTDF
jgi:serine/threonine-protein kinase